MWVRGLEFLSFIDPIDLSITDTQPMSPQGPVPHNTIVTTRIFFYNLITIYQAGNSCNKWPKLYHRYCFVSL